MVFSITTSQISCAMQSGIAVLSVLCQHVPCSTSISQPISCRFCCKKVVLHSKPGIQNCRCNRQHLGKIVTWCARNLAHSDVSYYSGHGRSHLITATIARYQCMPTNCPEDKESNETKTTLYHKHRQLQLHHKSSAAACHCNPSAAWSFPSKDAAHQLNLTAPRLSRHSWPANELPIAV